MRDPIQRLGSVNPKGWRDITGQVVTRGVGATDPTWTVMAGNFREAGYRESARDSTLVTIGEAGTTTAWTSPPAYEGLAWLQCAVSLEISGVARHCCHACPDLSHSGRRIVATTAYLYGSETADPPVSESMEDGEYAPKTALWESAP